MTDERRLVLTLLLCGLLIFAWEALFPTRPPTPAPTADNAAALRDDSNATATSITTGSPATGTTIAALDGSATATALAKPLPPRREIAFESKTYNATLDSRGAGLNSFRVPEYNKHSAKLGKAKKGDPIDLAATTGSMPLSLETTLGDVLKPGAPYEVRDEAPDSATLALVGNDAIELTKKITFHDNKYHADVELTVVAKRDVKGPLAIHISRFVPEDERSEGGMFATPVGIIEGACHVNESLESSPFTALGDEPLDTKGGVTWAGVNDQYFLAAVLPGDGFKGRTLDCLAKSPVPGAVTTSLTLPDLDLKAGSGQKFAFTAYFGPKELSYLKAVAPALEDSVNFWILGFICRPMLYILRMAESFTHNWGLAIIILTIFVNLVLYPVKRQAFTSMSAMQALKPDMDRIREQFKDDQARQQREMMELYKKHGVNPLGGCLPLLIQMPIWFALYRTINAAVDLYQQPFIPGWIGDLTAPDPFYILPVALGGLTYLQQKMTPQTMDNAQMKMMLYFMPPFFTFIMLTLPSALTLYIAVNSVISLVQQYFTNKSRQQTAGAAVPVTSGATRESGKQ